MGCLWGVQKSLGIRVQGLVSKLLKGVHIEEYLGDFYRGYKGGYGESNRVCLGFRRYLNGTYFEPGISMNIFWSHIGKYVRNYGNPFPIKIG